MASQSSNKMDSIYLSWHFLDKYNERSRIVDKIPVIRDGVPCLSYLMKDKKQEVTENPFKSRYTLILWFNE